MFTKATKGKLRGFYSNLKDIAEQREELKGSEKEVYQGVRDAGLSAKTLRKAVKIAMQDPDTVATEQAEISRYVEAMGGTPLEELIKRGKAKSDKSADKGGSAGANGSAAGENAEGAPA